MKKIFLFPVLFMSLSLHAQNPGDADVVRQMGEGDVAAAEEAGRGTQRTASAIGDAIGHFNTVMGLYGSAQDMYNNSRALSNGECAPDFATSDNVMMPRGCRRESECGECYRSAMGQLNFVRRQLGRLSCIYQNTKNFNNSAIAFGDNASGIHAVTGLAWQNARAEIVQTMNHFKQTYDNKYIDMIGALETALKAIDRCESQYGEEGWFQRSGFIYLEFMKDKYRRND
ncbi:MAG TPA: hypothetical protein VMZ03_03175 [Chitinophagaceae bacterium]|nr:hypothetical protein [Chitinophagaceae bacterium]